MARFQENMENACLCEVIFNGDEDFEISDDSERHSIFLQKKLCTCRAWDLIGIPCCHGICTMTYAKVDPMSEIAMWYHRSKYIAAYEHPMQLMPGKRFMKCDNFLPIEPPPATNMPGKLKKKRI